MSKNKIVVIDKEQEMGVRIKDMFHNISNFNYEIIFMDSLLIDEVKGVYCVIIDCRLIKEPKNLIDLLSALSVKKIIISTNELNHHISSSVMMMGATVFYRHSPVTTLLPKIIDNFSPQSMSKQNQSSLNTATTKNQQNSLSNTASTGRPFESDIGKFVLFYSPKGGVGKTSILLNCAFHLALKSLKVLVIDYSIFGSIRIKLKINSQNHGFSRILPSIENGANFNTFAPIVKNNLFSYSSGLTKFDVLCAGSPESMTNLSPESIEFINNIICSFKYDVILMDTSSDISSRNISLFEMANDIIIVASPDISSTWALIQHKELMQNLYLLKKCKLAINMHEEGCGFIPLEVETELQYPLSTIIPYSSKIKLLENSGSFISQTQDDPLNIYYRQLAHTIVPIFGAKDNVVKKNGFFSNIFKI